MLSEDLQKKYKTTLEVSPELILNADVIPESKEDAQELKRLAFDAYMKRESKRILTTPYDEVSILDFFRKNFKMVQYQPVKYFPED